MVLFILIVVFGGFFFIKGWWEETHIESDKPRAQIKKVQPPALPIKEPETKKLDAKMPLIEVHPDGNGVAPPKPIAEAAARFHWLILLAGQDSNAVLSELNLVTGSELYSELQGRFEVPAGSQNWEAINVYMVRQENMSTWQVNTIAVVNGEEHWLFERVTKEGDRWKVTEFSDDML